MRAPTTPVSHRLESPHPYENNMDLYKVVAVPGAKQYRVTFDSKSRTEAEYVQAQPTQPEAWAT